MKSRSGPLFDRIKTSKNLPTLPHILLKLIDACNTQGGTIKDISLIINKDSSLSVKVMKMVNSAYYGLPSRVTSMEQALLLLGTDAIKNIAISAAVFQVFGKARSDGVFKLKLFWYHCLLCATIAKLIAEMTSYSSSEEAFLSGLLHDIGKLVLWVSFPKDYTDVLKSSNNSSDLLLAAEKRLGATHCEVGAQIIGQWHLQSFMADAVLYHHEPIHRILDSLPLVKIVFVANVLSTNSVEESDAKFKTAQQVFGFAHADVEALISQGEQQVEQVAQSLGIEIEPPELLETPASDTDHQKEADLVRSVRDVSLLQGTLQNLLQAYGQKSILEIVKQGLQVLFDVNRALFLLYDPEKDALVGRDGLEPTRDTLVKELSISLETKGCLPVQSLEQEIPLDSFGHLRNADLAIIDQQIIRLVGTDGILCLPMVAHKEIVGVILLGLEKARVSSLCQQMNLLTMFSNLSALALHADNVRQVQAGLVQSERLAAASTVARKVAHEVNNPLGIIKNYIRILGLKLSSEDPAQEELRIISEELNRVANIVRKLSDFSEPEVTQTEPVDVNALLSDLIKITRESLMSNFKVNVQVKLEPSLPTIFSEKNGLKQVFINLIKNAVEAMPQGGNLYIQTRHISNAFQDQLKHDVADASDSVEITIRDEGPGIPDSIRSRLFEPFVTSKSGEHTGLGLSVAHNIVKELKGAITCESSKTTGTVFTIVLPVGHKQAA
jgi:signal transduction histidine kinase/HD-like signal output (HDOD) protein